jgi:hypothetical protein
MSAEARISELVLRVPGIRPEEAQQLVDDVIHRIRAGLPDQFQAVDLGRVDLRIPLPLGLGRDALADRIARAVLDQIHPGGAHG